MEEWYEELDFEENPFSTNPSDFVKNIVGRDEIIDDLIYRVRAGSLVFLEGEEGSGKSALLRVLIRKFRGKGKVIYVNCEKLETDLNIEDLLIQRNGFLKGMLMKQTPKNMILLLDNVPKLSHKNMERIKYFFDENFLKTVVFTGEVFKNVDFSKSLVQRIEGRVITLPKLETYQAVDMIRERIGDIKFISDELIEQVAELSNYNPKQILKSLEEISEYVVSIDEDVVEAKHVEQVLGKTIATKPEEKKETKKEVKAESKPVASKVEVVKDDSDADDFEPQIIIEEAETKSKPKKESPTVEVVDDVEEVTEDIEDVQEDEKEDDFVEEEVDEVSEDVIKKPIIADETEDNDDADENKESEDDDDFFADDFFDETEETKKSDVIEEEDDDKEDKKKKKSTDENFDDYDDFFDDDFDK